jgi:RNA polymerase sigma-70 factor, ECF subfamily
VTDPIQRVVAEVYRRHYRDLVAPLVRLLGSFEQAEDVAQEAFSAALEKWPDEGVPDEPLAWLRRVARNRALDGCRRQRVWQSKEGELTALHEQSAFELEFEPASLQDDVLRLIFTCCHPSLAPEAQIALTLRTVCGLTTEQVARSFLLKPQTLQQRLVRAKQKIDQAKIPFEIPERGHLTERLSAVLRTVYLVFNEGYGATSGETLVKRELCEEAIRLAQLLTELLPEQGEPLALLALMLLHDARSAARLDANGDLVTLDEQDRSLWQRASIERALPLVAQALERPPISDYAIEAAIAALHVEAPGPEQADRPQIAALYALLLKRNPQNPVIALNAAVAHAMAGDLTGGIERLRELEIDGRLAGYHLLPAAQGELSYRLGHFALASEAFTRALDLAANEVERRFLEKRRQRALDAAAKKN